MTKVRNLFAGVLFLFVFVANGLSAEPESIGTEMGKAARQAKDSAESSYQAASQETKKAAQEISATAKTSLETFKDQANKSLAEFQEAAKKMLETWNKELEKFKVGFSAPQNTAAQAKPAVQT